VVVWLSTGWQRTGRLSVVGQRVSTYSVLSRQFVYILGRGETYQLLKIPPADLHVSAVVVHALREGLCRGLAVVAPAGVVACLLGGDGGLGRGEGLSGGGTAGEEAADCVADGGSDCDTAVGGREG